MIRLLSLILCCCASLSATETIRVLGIGNSFTNDAFTYLKAFSEASSSHDLLLRQATIGGCPLDKHVRLFKEHEADPTAGLAYGYWVDGQRQACSLKDLLTKEPWDIVSIQQLSRLSVDASSYQPHADELIAAIKQYAPQAEVVIHQTWAYRADGDFAKVWPDREGYDQAAMYRDSASAYQQLAAQTGLRLIPTGAAFQLARERKPFIKDPVDISTLEPKALPNDQNSLNVGWYWKQKQQTLGHDSHHAGLRGDALAGAVWFTFLTGQDPRQLDQLTIPGLEAEDQAFLMQVAYDVVIEGKRPSIQPSL